MHSPYSPSDDSDNTRREKALGDLWASAYDGWIDVPGAGADVDPGTAIFARPVAARHAAADDAVAAATQSPPSPLASSPLLFPPIVTSSRLFALTGFNPMGAAPRYPPHGFTSPRLISIVQVLATSPDLFTF